MTDNPAPVAAMLAAEDPVTEYDLELSFDEGSPPAAPTATMKITDSHGNTLALEYDYEGVIGLKSNATGIAFLMEWHSVAYIQVDDGRGGRHNRKTHIARKGAAKAIERFALSMPALCGLAPDTQHWEMAYPHRLKPGQSDSHLCKTCKTLWEKEEAAQDGR